MARVSYVPFSQIYADLFAFCGIDLPTADFGGKTGWDAEAFGQAASAAVDYLNDNLDDLYNQYTEDEVEEFFAMLDNYSIFYWSTESPIYG